jgi:hypothetical protein
MREKNALEVLHPAGEEQIEFVTAGGKFALKQSKESLTAYGGIVPFAAMLKRFGIIERLAQTCPVLRTSPNAKPVADILVSFMLTVLAEGRRFAHVERLREDPLLAEIFGIKSIVGADTIRRLLASIDLEAGRVWIEQCASQLWSMLPDRLVLDWDSTVQTKYGHQEGACVGYNPVKPGRKSFHPLLAVGAGTRLCMAYRFRSGDTVTASQWDKAMEQARRWMGPRQVWLNRGDLGLGHEAIMRWHESQEGAPHYLFKLKQTKNVREAIHALHEQAWEGPGQEGVWQVAETRVKLMGWSRERRVVVARKMQGRAPAGDQAEFWKLNRYEYAAYVTDMDKEQANSWQVQALYNERGDAENVIDEMKNQWGFNGFCSGKKQVSGLAGQLVALVYNLWSLYMRIIVPDKHVEAVKSRRWFLLMAGKLVVSGRQKELAIGAQGAWWQLIKEGYRRVARWLEATAPQLGQGEGWMPDFAVELLPAPS